MVNFRPLAYKHLTFNSPLSEERADALVQTCSPVANILDLGCGWGELLLRMLAENPDATGIGIDNDSDVLQRGERHAREYGLDGRVAFITADASLATGEYDLVTAIGVTHLWGSATDALRFLRQRLNPDGKLLFGTGIYLKTPAPAIKEIFGELQTFEALQQIVRTEGFAIVQSDCATEAEWDSFESNWRRGLEESPDPQMRSFALERKAEYESGYRNVVGFCYMIATKLK